MRDKTAVVYREEDECGSCAGLIHEAVCRERGIVGVELDVHRGEVALDYDPSVVGRDKIELIADQLVTPIDRRQKNCSLRIGRQGGRACESCATLLERRLLRIPGVRKVTVSYRSGILKLTYDEAVVSPDRLLREVRRLGVDEVWEDTSIAVPGSGTLQTESRLRTVIEHLPLEAFFTGITFVAMAAGFAAEKSTDSTFLPALFYAAAYAAGGVFGLKAGLQSLRHRTVDIDLLMILAAIGAAIVGAPFEGAMLLFLFSLSNVLQDYALGRTRNAIKALMKLRPDQALVRREEELVPLPIEMVEIDDVFFLKPGDRIPLDGVVVTGESTVDQSSVTGESMPVNKGPNDTVFAGTINQNGSMEVRVTRLAGDSTIARLVKMVEEAQSEKAETQRFIDRAEQYYAMGVILFTLGAIIVPLVFLGEAFQTAFYRAMTLMVAASPCALVISTPATILSAIGNGARRGVLFKGGAHVEQAASVKVVAFDKTGTLTQGEPRVTGMMTFPSAYWSGSEDELLALAAAVQSHSEHALARAVVEKARARNLEIVEPAGFQAITGKGVSGEVNGLEIHIGNLRYYDDLDSCGLDPIRDRVFQLEREGQTSVVVAITLRETRKVCPIGILTFADVLRPGVAEIVGTLKKLGVEHVVMLTGDNHHVAARIAREAGIEEYHAELLPEDKLRILRELEHRYGPVAMIGDGVNDAPALASASLGIAMGAAGTDVALETADVVLMADDLKHIPYVIALSRKTRKTLITNLGFALAMILMMVAVIFSAQLPLPLAVIGHEGSTVLVSLNGLRLLTYRYSHL